MKLHEKPEDFKSAIAAAAQELKIREVYLEKDYWVTFVLKRLSMHPEKKRVVFKGGTSLSKAYKSIRRFSEDVDLAILQDGLNGSRTKNLISGLAKDLTKEPLVEVKNETTSKVGMSRKTSHEYPRNVEGGDFGVAKPTILLEVACFTKPTPYLEKEISSMVGEFLKRVDDKAIQEFGLEPFQIQILDWRVTFLEKILSLSYASFKDGESVGDEVRARVRHFYDLAVMFQNPEISEYLEGPQAVKDLARIRGDESLSDRTQWKSKQLRECALFDSMPRELARVGDYYEASMRDLVFTEDDLIEFKKVKASFLAIQQLLSKEAHSSKEK